MTTRKLKRILNNWYGRSNLTDGGAELHYAFFKADYPALRAAVELARELDRD